MLSSIFNLFKVPHRAYPKKIANDTQIKSIISYLSNGNILLQQTKYITDSDIKHIKKDIFAYFSSK